MRYVLIAAVLAWMLVASVVVLALYEWQWVVAALLLVAVFAVYPPRTWPVALRRWPTTRKEDDAQ